jgi:heptosyltransferase-2
MCEGCPEYARVGKRVLVIKLDAIGDVLRTTCVIEPILRTWPTASITWITAPEAVGLLTGLPGISTVIPTGHQALELLMTASFDLVLGLDAGAESARLTALARGAEKRGFASGQDGVVRALNSPAEAWFHLGLFDQLKRENRRTYQDLICQATELEGPPGHILFVLSEAERAESKRRALEWKLEGRGPIIGLNVGSGNRWPNKRWPLAHWRALIALLLERWPTSVLLLLGGPGEREAQLALEVGCPPGRVVATGWNHSVRSFAAIVELCDVVATGDTLALHLTIALRKRLVALFGPTASWEIEMYGLGERISPPDGCACFYQRACTSPAPCMETITPLMVADALGNELAGRSGHTS